MKLYRKYFSKKALSPTSDRTSETGTKIKCFHVINSFKINFEAETDPDMKRAYGYHDEGDFPLHLKQDHIENFIFYSVLPTKELAFNIFKTFNQTLRKKNLYQRAEEMQTFFREKYNICFFDAARLCDNTLPMSDLNSSLKYSDFCEHILPNLNIKLQKELNQQMNKEKLIYNWDFFIDEGEYNGIEENFLAKNLNSIPFQNLQEVKEIHKKKFYAFENLCELTHLSHEVKLRGLKINELQSQNLISEELVGRENQKTFDAIEKIENKIVRLFPKQRSIISTYKDRITDFNTELLMLEKALGNNQLPFVIL